MKKVIFIFSVLFFVCTFAFAEESSITVSSAPGSGGEWTNAISANRNHGVGILVYGNDGWSATITVRVSKDDGSTWYPTGNQFTEADAVSANGTLSMFRVADDFVGSKTKGVLHYQAGIDAGDYSSGDINIILWNGQ